MISQVTISFSSRRTLLDGASSNFEQLIYLPFPQGHTHYIQLSIVLYILVYYKEHDAL